MDRPVTFTVTDVTIGLEIDFCALCIGLNKSIFSASLVVQKESPILCFGVVCTKLSTFEHSIPIYFRHTEYIF